MAPIPKPPGMRQRRNKTTTRATLPSEAETANAKVPALPPISATEVWHPMVVEWWASVWRSPMAVEYLESDKKDLFVLARLHQDFWTATSSISRQSLAAEIRQQGQRFGLSPIDRRRLQWEIEKGERASQRTESRRKASKPDSKKDPRDVLKVVV